MRFAGNVLILFAIMHSLTEFLHLEKINQPWRILIGGALLACCIYAIEMHRKAQP